MICQRQAAIKKTIKIKLRTTPICHADNLPKAETISLKSTYQISTPRIKTPSKNKNMKAARLTNLLRNALIIEDVSFYIIQKLRMVFLIKPIPPLNSPEIDP